MSGEYFHVLGEKVTRSLGCCLNAALVIAWP